MPIDVGISFIWCRRRERGIIGIPHIGRMEASGQLECVKIDLKTDSNPNIDLIFVLSCLSFWRTRTAKRSNRKQIHKMRRRDEN